MRTRRLGLLVLGLMVLAAGAELFARRVLGLGDPPLSIADPQIEYLFKPSATYHRFGNVAHYNAWSMRSRDFERSKADPKELRVLLLGDSVVNGGAETDQAQLASSLLEQRLSAQFQRPVILGNVSAGSWGPPNLLAYVKRYGLFDADAVVIVLSSHDYADAPTFAPTVGVDPNYPDRTPVFALQEVFGRYLPRYVALLRPAHAEPPAKPRQRDIDWSLDSECHLIEMARSRGIPVLVAQHLEQHEYGGREDPGNRAIRDTAQRCGADVIALGAAYEVAMKRGEKPYRDEIHPSSVGQRIMADALEPWIVAHLSTTPAN